MAFRQLKIAIGGNATLTELKEPLQKALQRRNLSADVLVCDYATFEIQAQNKESALHRFNPDVIWHFSTIHDFKRSGEPSAVWDRWLQVWSALRRNSSAHILQNNFDVPYERPLGNLDSQAGLHRQVRDLNARLWNEAPSGVCVFDYDTVTANFGKLNWFDERLWYFGKYPCTEGAVPMLVESAAAVIAALLGQTKKCLVLDLDNTLWSGVLGEAGIDGIDVGVGTPLGEAFADFQRYALELQRRGVLLAVSSKNDEGAARSAFQNKSGMVLRETDIAAFYANWENKAENLRHIARKLNIRPDATVFVDDSPFERQLIKELVPDVTVPEMPEDPSEWIRFLDQCRLFETAHLSKEDRDRNQMMAQEISRDEQQSKFASFEEYLQSLNLQCAAQPLSASNLSRAVQLINKTNQFNLTAARTTEAELSSRLSQTGVFARAYSLSDLFGDYGLISVAVLRTDATDLIVERWVMSCRVFERGVEEKIEADFLSIARSQGLNRVVGCYRPTEKNKRFADIYKTLGYQRLSTTGSSEVKWTKDVPRSEVSSS